MPWPSGSHPTAKPSSAPARGPSMARGRPAPRRPSPAPPRRGMGSDVRAYTAQDIRFTKKGDIVYAFLMRWPADGKATIKSLATGSENYPKAIAKVELLGGG